MPPARGDRILPYFRPTGKQSAVIADFARGQVVADLGCGRSLAGTIAMVEAGAAHVHAVDNFDSARLQAPLPVGATFHHQNLDEHWKAPQGCTHALVSWPERDLFNDGAQWAAVLAQFAYVLYIGKNNYYTGCGNRQLWEHLAGRPILERVEAAKSDLLLYGPGIGVMAAPRCREEIGAWRYLIGRWSWGWKRSFVL